MEWYWWALIAVAVVFIFIRMRKDRPSDFSENEKSIISEWLIRKNLDPETVKFTIYSEKDLLSEGADKLFVGMAYGNGNRQGFVVETCNNKILDAITIHPTAASWHARCASRALALGNTLKGVLIEKSLMSYAGK